PARGTRLHRVHRPPALRTPLRLGGHRSGVASGGRTPADLLPRRTAPRGPRLPPRPPRRPDRPPRRPPRRPRREPGHLDPPGPLPPSAVTPAAHPSTLIPSSPASTGARSSSCAVLIT